MTAFARIHAPLCFRRPRARELRRHVCTAHLKHVETPASLRGKDRFLVLSDLHVKRESLETCLQVLSFAHNEALKRGTAVVFLGDFWHARGNLPVEPLNAVLESFSKWKVPLIMIPGNHDLITRSGHGVSLVPIATTVGDDNCLLITRPSLVFDALFLPYIHDTTTLKSVLKEVCVMPQRVQAIFCHVEVAGARLADKIISKSSARTLEPSDFPTQTRVYSGHIHRPHTVAETIHYVGSPYQVSASETRQEKELLVLDRTMGWQVVERIPIDIGPRHFRIHFDSPFIMPELRQGDRVVVQSCSDSTNFVENLRKAGMRVEQQYATGASHSSISEAGPLAMTEPRISSKTISNYDLFRQYAVFKNLGPHVTKAGLEILHEVGGRFSSSLSGKDVRIDWKSVTLEGFGPFLHPVKYPLLKRGIVLIVGRDCDEDGALTGRTNGTGKTSLAMAALWAMTGRTDARPDGSVEKGVALEMVHDNSKGCRVSTELVLYGERVLSEARDMMTAEERHQAQLIDFESKEEQRPLNITITRTSSRNGTIAKTRSYKQGLSLIVNGVDLSGLEVKETQSRIDRLVDGALLPHTVFFGQHMGAGRGLLDSTDRTLKDHLALVFPIEIWKEARRKSRARVSKLNEMQLTSNASLKAAEAVVARLEVAKVSLQKQLDDFEMERQRKITDINRALQSLIAGFSRWDEDSISFSESFAIGNCSDDLLKVIKELRRALRELDEHMKDNFDIDCASSAAEMARLKANLKADEDLCVRAHTVVQKAEEWERSKLKRMSNLQNFIATTENELRKMEMSKELDSRLRRSISELNSCDERLQKLVGLNDLNMEGCEGSNFYNKLTRVDSARKNASNAHEETVRLRVSLQEIRNQLAQSEEFATVEFETPGKELSTWTPLRAGIVTCDKCLRPFDGVQYEKARLRLMSEMQSIEERLNLSEEKKVREVVQYEKSVREFHDIIETEKSDISSRKKALLEDVRKLRAGKETRAALERDVTGYSDRLNLLKRERNFYLDQLLDLGLEEVDRKKNLEFIKRQVFAFLENKVAKSRQNFEQAEESYNRLKSAIDERERIRIQRSAEKQALQEQLDELHSLQAKCRDLETERRGYMDEGNPYEESLKLISAELTREREVVTKRMNEFQSLSDKIEVTKALDVAFGPRGVEGISGRS
ncbi:Calcineurin-like phosphoesterase [Gracilaria domingensis]|nr:Calcineurin-like phosphoesterase [Gracilaria domingensis]